jgi:hypothetical protein
MLFSLLAPLLVGAWAYGQEPAPTQQKPKPQNEARIIILSGVATPSGVAVLTKLSRVEILSASFERLNPGAGTWSRFVDSVGMPVPSELRNTPELTEGIINWPIIVAADPSAMYRITGWVKSSDNQEMDWLASDPATFHGYKPFVSQTLTLAFLTDSLKISATTPDIATLKAAWEFQGENPMAVQVSKESQSPYVKLPFAALDPKSDKGIPAMVLTIEDSRTHQTQEARVTVTVDTTPAIKQKVQELTNETNPDKRNKTKFSWGDLAKTGATALLKYFALAAL